ncbi:MAG: hypothetical protein FWD57_12880 [Polyangiaceae bacterium]|nr:hypothetical protein [Polyangiaceae bacterium]
MIAHARNQVNQKLILIIRTRAILGVRWGTVGTFNPGFVGFDCFGGLGGCSGRGAMNRTRTLWDLLGLTAFSGWLG